MKGMKCLGLSALATAVIGLALAGTASATTLTGAGGTTLGTGTEVTAENEGKFIFHTPIGEIECNRSSFSGKTTNSGGSGVSVTGNLESLSWSECNATVTVLSKGNFSIEGTGSSNGTWRSTGAEWTVEFLGLHCIFKASASVTWAKHTGSISVGGGRWKMHVIYSVPRIAGRGGAFCGTKGEWTGTYVGTSPSTLNIDE